MVATKLVTCNSDASRTGPPHRTRIKQTRVLQGLNFAALFPMGAGSGEKGRCNRRPYHCQPLGNRKAFMRAFSKS